MGRRETDVSTYIVEGANQHDQHAYEQSGAHTLQSRGINR